MQHVLEFVARHGAPVVFAVVLLSELGPLLPAPPILLALGALAGSERIDVGLSFVLALAASLCADLAWFQLGRWRGTHALGFLCRIALEPDTCVSKTRGLFARHGMKSLLVAKFVPGFDTVAPPLAGLLGVGVTRFLIWSGLGDALWIVTFGGLGYLFGDRVDDLADSADRFGSTVAWVIFGLLAIYLAWKYVGRQRVLRSIRTARITPEELHRMIADGIDPVIIDARDKPALDEFPFVIQGARSLTLEEIDARHSEIPRDREIIVYCA
jgi:membrane protein DedA with SNARE-associated domain